MTLNDQDIKEYWALRDEIRNMILSRLNDVQKEVVTATQGAVLCLAGAGSGKTTAMVYRMLNLLVFGDRYNYKAQPPEWLIPDDLEEMVQWLSDPDFEGEQAKRIFAMIGQEGVSPKSILAITFTNKAAEEMRERLRQQLGETVEQMWVMTFHSACLRMLKIQGEALEGYDRNFSIYDDKDQEVVVKSILKAMNLEDKKHTPRNYMQWISKEKTSLKLPPQNYTPMTTDPDAVAPLVYQRYQSALMKHNAMDFDDLLLQTVLLFQKRPDILELYQDRFKYIMVDEYQDTNHLQYVFVHMLAKKHGNLCVVGDDDQSIYGFRQADIRNILDFERDHPQAQTVRLEQNYRSTGQILEAANHLVAHNKERKPKKLWTSKDKGERLFYYNAQDDRDEAHFVASRIQQNVSKGGQYRDHAVLLRTNAQSRVLEEWFGRYLIPYVIIGGLRFYERKEIKDVLAYLKFIANPSDQVAWQRIINVPRRGIGDSTISQIIEASQKQGKSVFEVMSNLEETDLSSRAKKAVESFYEMILLLSQKAEQDNLSAFFEAVLLHSGYKKMLQDEQTRESQDRLENLKEFYNKISEYEQQKAHSQEEARLVDFLNEIALITDMDMVGEDARCGAVQVMTMHMAKGLEFSHVFIIGMEEGVFPHMRCLYNERELEEERRLCYVALTRAKEKLYLSFAAQRSLYGRAQAFPPSRFLKEIPDYLKESFPARAECFSSKTTGNHKQESTEHGHDDFGAEAQGALLKVGDRVLHKAWGEGMLVAVKGSGEQMTYQIAFPDKGIRSLLAKYAPLKKI